MLAIVLALNEDKKTHRSRSWVGVKTQGETVFWLQGTDACSPLAD
jgi:hypothetical protein